MKFKTTWRLLIIVCFLLAVVWLTHRAPSSRVRPGAPEPVMPWNAEDISRVSIEQGGVEIDCLRSESGWMLVQPIRARADESKIERLLSCFENMTRRETISAQERLQRELTLADYGLLEPRAKIVVVDKLGSATFLVGTNAAVGGLTYIRLDGEDEVIATSGELAEILPEGPGTFRDKTVLPGDVGRATRLEIQRPGIGFIQLIKTGGRWIIQQPEPRGAPADTGKVNDLLDLLFSLKVEKFIWDPKIRKNGASATSVPVDGSATAQVRPHNLTADEASARIAVWVNGGEVSKELILGKPAGEDTGAIYAKRRDYDSIFSVNKAILDAFSVTVNDLRDRHLFSLAPSSAGYLCLQKGDRKVVFRRDARAGWLFTEPIEARADDDIVARVVQQIAGLRVRSFATGDETNLVALGLQPPDCMIQLLREAPAEPAGAAGAAGAGRDRKQQAPAHKDRLWIGKPDLESNVVHARFEDEPVRFGDGATVYALEARAVAPLVADAANPLLYRDRTVLELRGESIKRISRAKQGQEHTVERNEANEWTVTAPTNGVPDVQAIDAILLTIERLRALRIESDTEKKTADVGLAPPSMTVTFGLRGDEAIQKTLMVGLRAEDKGVYAMVQGQDMIFVLDNPEVGLLARDLVKAPAPPPVPRPDPAVPSGTP